MIARKRILLLTTQLGYGGAETSFIRLANFLAETMNVTVALFTSDYGAGSYSTGHEPLNARIVLLDDPTPTRRLQRWWRRLVRLRALKAQHAATISFLSGPNLLNVLAGYHARSVVSIRGSRFYDPVAPLRQQWLFRYICDPIIFRLAARIVPISDGLKHEIRHSGGAQALAKTQVIPPFISAELWQQRLAEPAPVAYTALKGQKVIVAAGRLSVEKGFHHLIRVFAQLTQHVPDAKLLLIGDGPMLAELRAQCATLNLPMDDLTPGVASVIFAGYQKNVLSCMALGRVYAMCSATEGFANVILEALAAGLPVIAADTPWGARYILHPDGTNPAEPYPTHQPMNTPYGTLMPRIDLPEYASIWTETLAAQLTHPSPPATQRAADFDTTVIGPHWHALLRSMEP